jgi:hypothetical protein
MFQFGQAARFRVYGTNRDGKIIEVNKASGYELVWKVQVMNKKASWYTFMGNRNSPTTPTLTKTSFENVLRDYAGRRFPTWLYHPS